MYKKLLNSELGRVTQEEYREQAKTPVVLILDNIRSQHNIGAAFRTADAFALEKIYLCGICATPPSAEIRKAALGAEESVDWEYNESTLSVVERLKTEGFTPLAVEQTENSVMLNKFIPHSGKKYALIFGNEVKGVSQDVVDICEGTIEIPQFGTKHSLNVSVSVGVVLWEVVSKMGKLF